MGVLLPNGNDVDVINQLNTAFNNGPFAKIRNYINTSGDDFLSGSGKSLARASFRLNIWPKSGRKARKRWFAFLGRILSRQNQIDIQAALKTAVQNGSGNIVGMLFSAQFDSTVAANTYVVSVSQVPADAAGNVFVKVTLLCDHEIDPADAGDNDPPKDPGETGPIHPAASRSKRRRKPAKKATAKKAAKKARKR
jgi:hypothetical protein